MDKTVDKVVCDGYQINTEIIINANGNQVGAIQKISYEENSRCHIYGTCINIRLDKTESIFMHGIVHAASQCIPFDIIILDTFITSDAGDSVKVITTVIKNVWIKNIGVTYKADDIIILGNFDWEAECIE